MTMIENLRNCQKFLDTSYKQIKNDKEKTNENLDKQKNLVFSQIFQLTDGVNILHNRITKAITKINVAYKI